jgi:lysophospholipase L1-like esterase
MASPRTPKDPVTLEMLRREVERVFGFRLSELQAAGLVLSQTLPPRWLPDVTVRQFGDSLTAQNTPAHWQTYLYEKIVAGIANRFNVRFIGHNNGPPPLWNDGHPGFTLQRLTDEIDWYLNGHTATHVGGDDTDYIAMWPDLAITMGGINDIAADVAGSTVATRHKNLALAILAATKRTTRVICCIPPPWDARYISYSSGRETQRLAYVAALPAAINSIAVAPSPVLLVDCCTGYDSPSMNADGVHQNELGARFIADRIYNGIKAAGFGE